MTNLFKRRVAARVQAPPTGLSINLSSLNDYNVAQPFINIWLLGRGPLKGSTSGGGSSDRIPSEYLDEMGNCTELPPGETSYRIIWAWDTSNIPESGRPRLLGQYTITFTGTATITVSGASNVVQTGNTVTFDRNATSFMTVRVSGFSLATYPRNFVICKTDELPLLAAGETFKPDYKALVSTFYSMRFMDWGGTNESTDVSWADRRLVGANLGGKTIAKEYFTLLANETQTNIHVNIPHLADDDYVLQFATLVRDTLDPALTVRVEYTNEGWNFDFEQTQWAIERALTVWGASGDAYFSWYGKRAAECMVIWRSVFSAPGSPRLICVAGTQAASPSASERILLAPAWEANDPTNYFPPYTVFDELAITSYFGSSIRTNDDRFGPLLHKIMTNDDPETLAISQLTSNINSSANTWQDQADIAAQYGLLLSGYEGGTHLLHAFGVDDGARSTYGDGVSFALPYDLLDDKLYPEYWELSWEYRDDLNPSNNRPAVLGVDYTITGDANSGTITSLRPTPLLTTERLRATRTLTPAAKAGWVDWASAFSYSDDMAGLYDLCITKWFEVTKSPFPEFSEVSDPNEFGAWGTYRFIGDSNPRALKVRDKTKLVGVT